MVAVYVGPALLLVRSSYRTGWHLPGGGVRRGEMPEAAARRELAEEIGLAASALCVLKLPKGINHWFSFVFFVPLVVKPLRF